MMRFIQQFQRRTPLGWRQLSHQPGRLMVALAGIAFADVLMFMQLGFQNALYDSNTRFNRALQADIILLSPKARSTQNLGTFTRRRLYQAMNIPGVQSADALYISTLTWKNPQTKRDATVQMLGVAPERPAFNLPEITQQLDKIKPPNTVLFDRLARGEYSDVIEQVTAGKAVTTEAERNTLRITGLFSLGASFGADANVITSDQTFLRLFPRREATSISLGLVRLQPGADLQSISADLKAYLPNDVRVLTFDEYIEFEENYWKSESPIGFIFSLGAAMAFVVGVVIVYQVLSTDVNAHLKEYATFKAMGYQNAYLLGVVFEEAIILALLGFIPGVILPIGLYALAANATALPLYMTVSRSIFVLMLTITMCAISGGIATRKLQSADPADMF